MIKFLYAKLFKKIRGAAILNSQVDKSSKIEAGNSFYNSIMGKYSFCGYDCEIYNSVIGNYCSIANNVVIGGAAHPIDWVSMSPVFYKGRDSISKKFVEFERPIDKKTIIGHDVWIGQYALIKQGVTVGHGAVVGMGSVVTKDIPPYEVWAGNPAKLIKKRFDEDIIKKLLDSEWWNKTDTEIERVAPYIKDIEQFLKNL